MTGFQLSLPGFEGPVEALQPMVSSRQIALDELPLAAIPAQFLAETVGSDQMDLEVAGEVLSALSRLMLLKSIRLLAEPESEEEPEVEARTDRTPMRELREAAVQLTARQGGHSFASMGSPGLVPRLRAHRPAGSLVDAWAHICAREGKRVLRAAVPSFVRLEVAVSRIVNRLRSGRAQSLSSLIGTGGRRDAVMLFLAMLELRRRGDIRVEQDATFEEITLDWAHTDDRRQSRAG